MKHSEINLIATLSILFAVLLGISYFLVSNSELNFTNGVKAISYGISIVTIFWSFYIKWGWKWCLLKRIFYRPNVNGTWAGELESDYKDENGNLIPPKKIFLVIRQDFLRINISSFTDNFIGRSYSESFRLKKKSGIKNISYLYRKETSMNYTGNSAEGGAELRLIESRNNILEGKYWTNNKTNGTYKVTFITRTYIDCVGDALLLINTNDEI